MTHVIMFIAIMAITTHISFGQKTLLEDVKTITLKRYEKQPEEDRQGLVC